jgi:hypothetical protein
MRLRFRLKRGKEEEEGKYDVTEGNEATSWCRVPFAVRFRGGCGCVGHHDGDLSLGAG